MVFGGLSAMAMTLRGWPRNEWVGWIGIAVMLAGFVIVGGES